jgi:peptidoglycan hydrolase-like protein with peptidoglycan-binding domain
MRIPALPARHRRLLALCALSLALHLLVLYLIAHPHRSAPLLPQLVWRGALTARLQPAPQSRAPAAATTPSIAAVAAAPAPTQPIGAAPAPDAAAVSAAATEVAPDVAAATASGAEPATPVVVAAVAPAPPAPPSGGIETATEQQPLRQMPRRYRVRLPPNVRLSFALTSGAAAPAPPGHAFIDWRVDADQYRLRMEGVAGTLDSRGAMSDSGIAPQTVSETLADGSNARTRFDHDAGRIVFTASGRSSEITNESQDRASMLMQLAGIGLATPNQIKGVIELFVGAADAAGIVRFEVSGEEQLASGLGPLATVHLTELARPGASRLEVWLAPAHHWYPVQLRVTGADGAVRNQLITAIEGDRR